MSTDSEDTKTMAEVQLIATQADLSRATTRCTELEKELELLRRYLRSLNVNPTIGYLREIYGE